MSKRKNEPGRGEARYYYRADPLLGFDISPLARRDHEILDGLNYEIFANDLGCFDKNFREYFSVSTEHYVYFAGDSFTWGYAPYENKFATVWEEKTGILAAKCGVPHTGTRHQFEKFKRVTKAIGHLPTRVFVGFTPNDVANDFTFPHSTVIEGFLVDMVHSNGRDQFTRMPYQNLVRKVTHIIQASNKKNPHDSLEPKSVWQKAKILLLRYSLLTNVLNTIRHKIFSIKNFESNSDFGESIYRLMDKSKIKTEFTSSPLAEPTKKAIKEWHQDAKAQGYQLIFILIPSRENSHEPDLFVQVKEFLRNEGVEFIDLALVFRQKGWTIEDLYWRKDTHLNSEGNRHIGLELASQYR